MQVQELSLTYRELHGVAGRANNMRAEQTNQLVESKLIGSDFIML